MNKEVLEAAASLKLCLDRISQLQKAQEWASATGATPNTRRHCKVSQEIQRWYVEAQNARNALSLAVIDALYPETEPSPVGLNISQLDDYSLLKAFEMTSRLVTILNRIAQFQNTTITNINPEVMLNALKAEMNRRTLSVFQQNPGWIDQIITSSLEMTDAGVALANGGGQ